MTLRTAVLADLPLLEEWDRDPDVIASGGDDDWGWEHELPRTVPWREMWIAEADGESVGFIQAIDAANEETHYWGDVDADVWALDIWIGSPRHRNRGIGTAMLSIAIERCFSVHGAKSVLIDPLASNHRAIRFYQRLGFGPVAERRFGDDDCLVMELAAAEWPGTPPDAT